MLASCPALHGALTLVKSSENSKTSPEAKIKVNRHGRGTEGLGEVRHMALESSLETI